MIRSLAMLFLLGQLVGCATIVGDTTQPITLITTCEGSTQVVPAQCTLSNGPYSQIVETPGVVEVRRGMDDLRLDCRYQASGISGEGSAVLKSGENWNSFGNLIFGGLVGVAVDMASGAGFEYPKSLTLSLKCPVSRPAR